MSGFKFRILFVDDEASVRETARAILQDAGYEVVTAHDGLDALKFFEGPLPELVITDLRMPRMSGFEFLAVLRNRFPQVPTVALSGEYSTEQMPESLLADAYLQKASYEVPEFLRTIKELLNKAPVRPFPGTRANGLIWVPLKDGGQVIVTCPKCLRSSDVDASAVKVGLHQTTCIFCHNVFSFNIDQSCLKTVSPNPSDSFDARTRKRIAGSI